MSLMATELSKPLFEFFETCTSVFESAVKRLVVGEKASVKGRFGYIDTYNLKFHLINFLVII